MSSMSPQRRDRPNSLESVTQRITTGYGKVYVTIGVDDEGEPFEVFVNAGDSGGFANGYNEALGKTISNALRSGTNARVIAEDLRGIRSPRIYEDEQDAVRSIPDAIGLAMLRFLEDKMGETLEGNAPGNGGPDGPRQVTAEESMAPGDPDETIDDICPDCGEDSLYYSEGCKTCESCGWSEC